MNWKWVVGIVGGLVFAVVITLVISDTEVKTEAGLSPSDVTLRSYGPHNHVLGLKNGHPLNRTGAEAIVHQYLTTHGLEVVGVYERRQEGDPTSLIVRKK